MKLLSITVRGAQKTWSFSFYGDPKHIEEWRDDGLDVVEICNTVTEWVNDLGLVRPWCFVQDILNFRSPWK